MSFDLFELSNRDKSEFVDDISKKLSEFHWPLLRDAHTEKFIKKYMYSFKNIFSENINITSLMFITGPSKVGKSWILEKCLHDFKALNSTKIESRAEKDGI